MLAGLLVFFLLAPETTQATHLRAGNIYAKSDTTAAKNPLRFFFKLVTYSVLGGFEDTQATLYFGDCTNQLRPRTSRVVANNGQNDTYVNVYYFEHTYTGPGTFTVTFIGENRVGGIVNMQNSVDQTFVIQSQVTVDPFLGINRSPILLYDPLDIATRNQIFIHNPGAYDDDGDSLAFKLVPVRVFAGQTDACGNPSPATAPGFQSLDRFLGVPVNTPTAFFTLNQRTGQLTWNTPPAVGIYNIAFAVEEWRNGRLIGFVIRDMQIRVIDNPNRPPVLFIPRDTCVIAGTTLRDTIRVTDPDRHRVNVTAIGEMLPPGVFRKVLNDTTYVFEWVTTCEDVRTAPYQVLFRAEDIPPTGVFPLVDLQPWQITVVGPPPVLTAAFPQSSNSIKLTWDRYTCSNATTIYIYRKENPSTFEPTTCEVGIPASAGYTLVGEVSADQTEFLDNNNGQGLLRNRTYCYRIYAEFPYPSNGKSIASNELCASLESISMTKVSVTETSTTTGQMRVEWSKPRAILAQLTAPLEYRLLRAVGQSRAATVPFTEIRRTQDLNDTVFTDTNLNTQEQAYTYRVEFYHAGNTGAPTILVDSSSASSVRLRAMANGPSMVLNWTYNVPWNNASAAGGPYVHDVYLSRAGGPFTLVNSVGAGATAGTLTQDVTLEEGVQYCAYVVTRGTFQNPLLPDPIVNNSQVVCFTRPCVPVLSIDPLVCDENFRATGPPFQNLLSWSFPAGSQCDPAAIDFYTLYYKATDEEEFKPIATVEDMSYVHQNLLFYSGCYVLTATDMFGNESERSNIVCKDNCIIFILPNIFTPNGDGKNDVFTPQQGAAFIKTAKLIVYNRWGNRVFEGNQEPGLNWRGVDNSGKALADGTYFYQVEVEFYGRSATPDRRTFKGWVEIIH